MRPAATQRTRRSSLTRLAGLLLLAVVLAFVRPSHADDTSVPAEIQADLIDRLQGFDRNFAARAANQVVVMIVVDATSAASQRYGSEVLHALQKLPTLAGLPHVESVVAFRGATALAADVRASRAAIVYLCPHLSDAVPATAQALQGVDVLTMSGVTQYVAAGVVVGLGLESGRPKMYANLRAARAQHVDFRPEVLRLMTIVEGHADRGR